MEESFKSPKHKLLSFFRRSQLGWKSKCGEAKRELKFVKNKLKQLEDSRSLWRKKAEESLRENESLQKEVERLKKKLCRGSKSRETSLFVKLCHALSGLGS